MKIKDIHNGVFFDTETTGLDIRTTRILEYGLVRVRDDKIVDKYRMLVNPHYKDDYSEATRVHGITPAMVEKEGIDAKLACRQVLDFIGNDIVLGLNNVAYDNLLLDVECNRHGFPRISVERLVDVGLLHKGICIGNIYNEQELFFSYANRIKEIRAKGVKFNLNYLVKTYNIENLRDNDVHGALQDATMTSHVFLKIKEQYYK